MNEYKSSRQVEPGQSLEQSKKKQQQQKTNIKKNLWWKNLKLVCLPIRIKILTKQVLKDANNYNYTLETQNIQEQIEKTLYKKNTVNIPKDTVSTN